jgi:hypothetical protein
MVMSFLLAWGWLVIVIRFSSIRLDEWRLLIGGRRVSDSLFAAGLIANVVPPAKSVIS